VALFDLPGGEFDLPGGRALAQISRGRPGTRSSAREVVEAPVWDRTRVFECRFSRPAREQPARAGVTTCPGSNDLPGRKADAQISRARIEPRSRPIAFVRVCEGARSRTIE
jgi:hypothetical protein